VIKYLPETATVVLEEIPDKVTLAVEITNCQGHCEDCHSPHLRDDLGEELTPAKIDALFGDNFGVNCFLFLGEGKDVDALLKLVKHINKKYPSIEVALYSGLHHTDERVWDYFDYVKIGPYRAEYGPLNKPTTNQRMYRLERGKGKGSAIDITERFWHGGIEAQQDGREAHQDGREAQQDGREAQQDGREAQQEGREAHQDSAGPE